MLDPGELIGLFAATGSDEEVGAPWMKPGDIPFLFSRASWALRAVVDGWARMNSRAPHIWFPDFFCNHALGLLRDRAQISFYPIDERLNPVWSADMLVSPDVPPDIFVLVHYFGYPSDAAPARRFCGIHGAALIEDAAHVLAPYGSIGEIGDATIWSPYKHLPVPDGGLLCVRRAGRFDVEPIREVLRSRPGGAPSSLAWFAKRMIQATAPAIAHRLRSSPPPFDIDPISTDSFGAAAMSDVARRLIAHVAKRLPVIAQCRRDNAVATLAAFAPVAGLQNLFPAGPSSAIPYRAVLRAADHAAARKWYDRLTQSGNIVESWPDLPPEVRATPDRHPIAVRLRNTILTLPVHANWTPEDMTATYRPLVSTIAGRAAI